MTKEQYERLEKYKKQFTSAIQSKFVRMSQGEFNELNEIYREMYGVYISRSQMTCSSCKLKAVQRIGEDFFKYEDWYKKRWGDKKSNVDSNTPSQSAVEGTKE